MNYNTKLAILNVSYIIAFIAAVALLTYAIYQSLQAQQTCEIRHRQRNRTKELQDHTANLTSNTNNELAQPDVINQVTVNTPYNETDNTDNKQTRQKREARKRKKHKNIILQSETAYQRLGTPLKVEEDLKIHAQIDISQLITLPRVQFNLAAELQQGCDAMLMIYARYEKNPRYKFSDTYVPKFHKFGKVDIQISRSECERRGYRLPSPYNRHYEVALQKYIKDAGNDIAVIDAEIKRTQDGDYSIYYPNAHHYKTVNKNVLEQNGKNVDKGQTHRISEASIFTYRKDGHYGYVLWHNKQHTVPKSLICADEPDKDEWDRKLSLYSPNSGILGNFVQECYNTVEHIEVKAVGEQKKILSTLTNHQLSLDRKTREQLVAMPKQRERRKRKRFVNLLATFAGTFILDRVRHLASAVVEVLAGKGLRRTIAKTAFESRKSHELGKDLLTGMKILKPTLAIGGLGYQLFRDYHVDKTLKTHQRHISALETAWINASQRIDTIALAADRHEEQIKALANETDYLRNQLAQIHQILDVLALLIQANNVRLNVLATSQETTDEINRLINTIAETATAVDNGDVPPILSEPIKEAIKHYDLRGEYTIPHPHKPAVMGTNVTRSLIDIYIRFAVGKTRWEFYRIHPLPVFENGRAYIRNIDFEYALVSTNMKTYIPVQDEEAAECRKGICVTTGVVQEVGDDNCTITMIALEKPNPTCIFTEVTVRPRYITTEHGLIFSVPEPRNGLYDCGENHPWSQHGIDAVADLRGWGFQEIPPGCKIDLVNPDIVIHGPPLQNVVAIDPTQLTVRNNKHQLKTPTVRADSVFDSEILAAHESLKHRVQTIQVDSDRTGLVRFAIITSILTTISLLIAAVIGRLIWLRADRFQIIRNITQVYESSKHSIRTLAESLDQLRKLVIGKPTHRPRLKYEKPTAPPRSQAPTPLYKIVKADTPTPPARAREEESESEQLGDLSDSRPRQSTPSLESMSARALETIATELKTFHPLA